MSRLNSWCIPTSHTSLPALLPGSICWSVSWDGWTNIPPPGDTLGSAAHRPESHVILQPRFYLENVKKFGKGFHGGGEISVEHILDGTLIQQSMAEQVTLQDALAEVVPIGAKNRFQPVFRISFDRPPQYGGGYLRRKCTACQLPVAALAAE